MRRRLHRLIPLAVILLVAAVGCTDEGNNSSGTGGGEFPRKETLFTSGQQWGPPSSWNPLPGTQATGVRGLIYETLFTFDPWKAELQPYLAESGKWVDKSVFEVTLRDGIKWTDGKPMTSEDVVFTAELGKNPAVPYSNLWNYLAKAEAVDSRTARFTFSDPRIGEWDIWTYSRQILPKHLWSSIGADQIMAYANANPVGSGPYKYKSHNDQRQVLVRNDDWWAIKALDLKMPAKYIVDVVNPSNEVALGMISRGQLDLSNNFLPGINQLVEGDFNISTYYADPPYMLAANTAYLIPNTTRKPMNDAAFRRALAYSVNVKQIVEKVYQKIVKSASPTGLLPTWDKFVDKSIVDKYGFGYDPNRAKEILTAAGYKDTNGDKLLEAPDGSTIALKLITPAGWTDWNAAAQVIAEGAKAVGINVVAETPDSGAVDDARTTGNFDLLMNNWTTLDASPWQLYNYLFQLPVQAQQPTNNFARYTNQEAWTLTQQVGRMSVQDPAIQQPQSRLQEIMLTEMPAIPMWYNGLWSQVNNDTWTNWPTDQEGRPHFYPSTWGGWFEKGGVFMLADIKLAK